MDGIPVWREASPGKDRQVSPALERFSVPPAMADVSPAGDQAARDVILNIQDAHSSLSAQYRISSLLEKLVSEYDLRVIALEGADGYVDTSLLSTFPDRKARDRVAEGLLAGGLMNAGEFFAVTGDDPDIALYGVEDSELYQKNLEGFRRIMNEHSRKLGRVRELAGELERLAEEVYCAPFSELEKSVTAHQAGDIGFAQHWKELEEIASRVGTRLRHGVNARKLVRAISIEESIDFKAADQQRKRLMDELSTVLSRKPMEDLVLMAVRYKRGEVSPATFHRYLGDLAGQYGIDPARYRDLCFFSEYLSCYEDIDMYRLFREIDEAERSLRARTARDPLELELSGWIHRTRLLRKLYSARLNNAEYRKMISEKDHYAPAEYVSFMRRLCSGNGIPLPRIPDLDEVFSGVDGSLEFYRVAEKRNSALLANTVRRMKEEDRHVAALISGGYHTEGLTRLMRERGVACLVVVPRFAEGRERPYIAVLTSKKTPYEKVLEGERYQLAVKAFFSDMDETRFLHTAMMAFGEVALRGGDWKPEAKRWYRMYSREYARLETQD
ncbi:MAG: hypothetical protein GF392_05180, partial [Candidatus Omnitrophica bacterium]|nr:hypothetical protein [Candidatus Omnitrophota bacterium]